MHTLSVIAQLFEQPLYENDADPVGESMCCRRPIANVECDHRDSNGQGDHDHCEQEIESYQGNDQTRTGNDFHEKEKEDGQTNQDRDAKNDFLSAVAWKIKDEYCEQRYAHAGYDEICGVEESFPTDIQIECYIHIGSRTAIKSNFVS